MHRSKIAESHVHSPLKFLMKKFPRGTGWAIFGFVIGSIPAIFMTKEFITAPVDGVQIAIGAILCLAGVIASYALASYAEAHSSKKIDIN